MSRYTIIGLWIFSFTFGISMSFFWWVAAFNDWRVTIEFAKYGAQWVEGTLFHMALLTSIWGGVEIIRGVLGSPGHRNSDVGNHCVSNAEHSQRQ